jgi:hypothetical protein
VDDGKLPAGGHRGEGLEIAAEETNRKTIAKEKPVMRKVRNTLPIVLPALVILGMLAVAGHAGKPVPPVPTVTVSGGIEGTGNPKATRITFADLSFRDSYPQPDGKPVPSFPSNPDAPLTISAAGGNRKTLMYCYCVHPDHLSSNETVCSHDQTPSHDPYYYCLWIHGGVQQQKSTSGEVVFPVGSPWYINSKAEMKTVAQGTLLTPVAYKVLE